MGVLDKAVRILEVLRDGPAPLAELVERSGLARPTAYRLAVALERLRLVRRDPGGRFAIGPRLAELAAGDTGDRLVQLAPPVLARLRDETGESVQLYRREGEARRCVAATEPHSGLRDSVPVGALLPLSAGSGAHVLLAWERPENLPRTADAAGVSPATLALVRRRGWAASVAEREPGVASISAPVREPDGTVVAALCLSGPIDRLGRRPGLPHATAVVAAAETLTTLLSRPDGATARGNGEG